MMQQILTQFPWPWLPTFALLIFFAFFTALIVRVSLKSRQHIFTAAQSLPLEDGDQYE